MPLVSFYTPWQHEKPSVFLMFYGAEKVTSGMKWVEQCFISEAITVEAFNNKGVKMSVKCFFEMVYVIPPLNNSTNSELRQLVEVFDNTLETPKAMIWKILSSMRLI